MFKKIFFVVISFCVFNACFDDSKGIGEYQEVGNLESSLTEDGDLPLLEDGDYIGMAKHALRTVQSEFNKCEGKAGLGKVTVFLDQNFNLLIKNVVDGDVIETKVNLKDLNPENGGFKLLPDDAPGTYPGISVLTLNADKKVETTKNGKLVSKDYHLDIRMAERKNIETIAPAVVQAVTAAHARL